jgi:glycosyltransferase involved in cell wall biosynthesis
VLLIDDLEQWRGTETHLYRLMGRLRGEGIRSVVAVVGRAALVGAFRQAGFAAHALDIFRVFAPAGVAGVARIASLVRREKAGLLVSYHAAADLLGPPAALLAGVPTLSCRRDEGFTKKPIHVAVQRRLNRLVRGMISVSEAAAQAAAHSERFPRERMRVIWNGEDLELYRPGPSLVRGPLGLGPEACVITCVAGLDPVKDHGTLLEAFARVAPRHPQAVLLLAGDGPERGSVERRAAPFGGRVRVLGQRDDIPDLLRATDIYVQTSTTEGFSNAILQAMATALPVVATRVGGNPELVTSDCGLLLPPRDPAAVAEGLGALVADAQRRRALGDAGRRRVEAHGSLQGMAASYAEAFRAAINGSFPGYHERPPMERPDAR